MSGFETGAIQSIKNNQKLRRGAGQLFKGNLYHKGYIGGGVSRTNNKKLIERADEQRKAAITSQLMWVTIVAIIACIFVIRLVNNW